MHPVFCGRGPSRVTVRRVSVFFGTLFLLHASSPLTGSCLVAESHRQLQSMRHCFVTYCGRCARVVARVCYHISAPRGCARARLRCCHLVVQHEAVVRPAAARGGATGAVSVGGAIYESATSECGTPRQLSASVEESLAPSQNRLLQQRGSNVPAVSADTSWRCGDQPWTCCGARCDATNRPPTVSPGQSPERPKLEA